MSIRVITGLGTSPPSDRYQNSGAMVTEITFVALGGGR
jgi:hypothetical protein